MRPDAALAETLFAQGAQALAARDPGVAQGAFEQAARAGGPSARTLTAIGLCRYLQGDSAQALDRFREAVTLDPAHVDARSMLVLALARLGHLEEAPQHIEAVAALLGGPTALIGTFLARMLELRDPDAVITATHAWRAAFPGSVAPLAAHATALQDLGREAEYHRLMAFGSLMHVTRRFDQQVTFDGPGLLNPALCESMAATARVDVVRERKTTQRGEQTVHLDPQASPAMQAFFRALHQAIATHADRVTQLAPDHEWVRMKPAGWSLRAWGVLLDQGGHQNPHIHPAAWLSGVYYPRMPAAAVGAQPPAGWLEIGRASPYAYANPPTSLQVQMIRPEEGTLVLFPSYYWHATGPATAPGRVSLAFDVVGNATS